MESQGPFLYRHDWTNHFTDPRRLPLFFIATILQYIFVYMCFSSPQNHPNIYIAFFDASPGFLVSLGWSAFERMQQHHETRASQNSD